jgi:UDP-N-acetylmuramoyl-tripeptide--D-alanyl-D-alanine ligase
VDDVLGTLQKLATYHRTQLMIPVIGITGSNGKTTTKELINAVLKKRYLTFATQGNLNNHIGVPLSVLSIQSNHELAIIEMGANHQGEIATLSNISKPDFGIITNIGKAHLEGFGGYKGVIKAKTELYRFIRDSKGKLFVNAADPLLLEKSEGIKSIYYGNDDRATVAGEIIEKFPFITARMLINNDEIIVKTQMVGAYNLDNMLAAACIGNHFGISPQQIKEAIENYAPKNHR